VTGPIGSESTSPARSSRSRVHSERGRALLALVLEGAADHRGAQHLQVGGGVGDDEVLAAGLPDDPRVGAVVGDVGADGAPQVLEDRRRAGEVDAGQVAVGEHHVGDRDAVAGQHVDDAVGQAGGLQQAHQVVGGELLGGRGLPDHRVAHQGRRGGQVAGDGGEVERGDGVDDALQRAVVHPVPDAGRGHRLLRVDLPGEVHVVAPEVGQLAGAVDLGLLGGLGLPEHRRP
jgi:hypothetical protein